MQTDPNAERRRAFDQEIKPLMNRIYDLAKEHGCSMFCTTVFGREDQDFDQYTVATGKTEMMPDKMLAVVGMFDSDMLKHISAVTTETILRLHEDYREGRIDGDDELDDKDVENMRLANTFSHYADALRLSGPFAFRRTRSGFELLDRIISSLDDEEDDEEEDEEEEEEQDSFSVDSEIEDFLRNVIERKG